jgi:hypothetical protein
MEQMPQLDDGRVRVAVRSVKVTGALSRLDALSGLADALPHLQRALKDSRADGESPRGSFGASFRTEPDGMIRMVLEGDSRLTGSTAPAAIGSFIGSAMGRQWQFPRSSGPSLVEAEFAVGEP